LWRNTKFCLLMNGRSAVYKVRGLTEISLSQECEVRGLTEESEGFDRRK
jgi:hypothetical protein